MRRTPLRRISTKNAAKERELAAAKAHVRWRSNGLCEARTPACPEGWHRGVHVHHLVPRSKSVDHSPDNLRLCCEASHSWIHSHPAEARQRGLLA